jgi:hypothetical protein
MSKIILEFDSIEEAQDARDAIDGWKWKHSIWELDQWLRGEVKYKEGLSEETHDIYDKLREKIREILDDNGLNIES